LLNPNFDKILYRDSPFVPPVTIESAYRILASVTVSGDHPAVAIAEELIDLFTAHNQFLEDQKDWIMDNFPVDEDGLNRFYFGLIMPPGLILAADMIEFFSEEETLDALFPQTDNLTINGLRKYAARQIPLVGKLLHREATNPMLSVDPIYERCTFDIMLDCPWYLLGLEAGKRTFQEFAKLH